MIDRYSNDPETAAFLARLEELPDDPPDRDDWPDCEDRGWPPQQRTILACGSRHWTDRAMVRASLLRELRGLGWPVADVTLIHGDCRGADHIAAEEARALGLHIRAFPPDWSRGRRAGPERNLRMLAEAPDLVLAFGDGSGTNHTVREAEARGLRVVRVR